MTPKITDGHALTGNELANKHSNANTTKRILKIVIGQGFKLPWLTNAGL